MHQEDIRLSVKSRCREKDTHQQVEGVRLILVIIKRTSIDLSSSETRNIRSQQFPFTMFESVLSTNFDAVCLLRRGRFDESMYLLRMAMAAVQAAGNEPLDSSSAGAPHGIIASVPLQDYEDDLSFKMAMKNKTSCFDLFERAFIFQGPQSLGNTDENASLCAAVGLYNMALNMHMKGLHTGASIYLVKACGLYQKVFTIIRAVAPAPTDSVAPLFLAAVLNMICCESELRGAPAAQEWKNVYSELFTWATQSESSIRAMEPEDLETFCSNAVLLSNQDFCSAPAA